SCIGDDELGTVRLHLARDERGGGLALERGTDEIMAVARVLQRDEEIAGLERARVDGEAVRLEGMRRVAERRGHRVVAGPQRAHAQRLASSRSLNGRVTVPTVWPV